MDVSVGPRWKSFIESIVAEGRYASADPVMREGLRLLEEREQKMKALRETIQASIAQGRSQVAVLKAECDIDRYFGNILPPR